MPGCDTVEIFTTGHKFPVSSIFFFGLFMVAQFGIDLPYKNLFNLLPKLRTFIFPGVGAHRYLVTQFRQAYVE